MRHFRTEEWIDFVNQAVSPGDRDEMENHLKEGCQGCREAVSMWQRVQRSAVAERNYQPPAATLRIVKAAFVAASLKAKEKNPGAGSRSSSTAYCSPLSKEPGRQLRIQDKCSIAPIRFKLTCKLKPNPAATIYRSLVSSWI